MRTRDPESFGPWNRDPGWKKFGSGIRDKHPESAKLILIQKVLEFFLVHNHFSFF
jgi:hypothetical protein